MKYFVVAMELVNVCENHPHDFSSLFLTIFKITLFLAVFKLISLAYFKNDFMKMAFKISSVYHLMESLVSLSVYQYLRGELSYGKLFLSLLSGLIILIPILLAKNLDLKSFSLFLSIFFFLELFQYFMIFLLHKKDWYIFKYPYYIILFRYLYFLSLIILCAYCLLIFRSFCEMC